MGPVTSRESRPGTGFSSSTYMHVRRLLVRPVPSHREPGDTDLFNVRNRTPAEIWYECTLRLGGRFGRLRG